MKKILVAGSNYADVPMILAAKKLGLYVVTSGNNLQDIGCRFSDEHSPCDYSDKIQLANIVKELKVDAICPCCNDFSAFSSAYAARELNLPGMDSPQTLSQIMHKDNLHKLAEKLDLPVAKAKTYEDLEKALAEKNSFSYPVIVKPVDMTGGKGISKVECCAKLRDAILFAQKSSRTSRFIIEEFLLPDTAFHNYVGFVGGGSLRCGWSDDEWYYYNPYLVGGMSMPARENESIICQLEESLNKIIKAFLLKPGIIMAQYCTVNGNLKIIEIGRRMPGNLHGKMIELATGFNISEWTIRAALGESCENIPQVPVKGFWGEYCIMAPANGRVKNVEFTDAIKPNLCETLMLRDEHAIITNFRQEKLGIVLLEYASMEEMLEKQGNIPKYIRVHMT